MFDYVRENIIEITMVYAELLKDGKIYTEDSMEGKLTICDLAEEFEKVHINTDWGAMDYFEEIEKFSKEKLMERFGK